MDGFTETLKKKSDFLFCYVLCNIVAVLLQYLNFLLVGQSVNVALRLYCVLNLLTFSYAT